MQQASPPDLRKVIWSRRSERCKGRAVPRLITFDHPKEHTIVCKKLLPGVSRGSGRCGGREPALSLAAFSIATRRRIMANASAIQGSEKSNLVQEERKVQGVALSLAEASVGPCGWTRRFSQGRR